MLELTPIWEFSRNYCVAICTFLVPAILLATLQTLILLFFKRDPIQVRLSAILGISLAVVMCIHVGTWFAIGVVMAPTFILVALATVSLAISLWATTYPTELVVKGVKLLDNFSRVLISRGGKEITR